MKGGRKRDKGKTERGRQMGMEGRVYRKPHRYGGRGERYEGNREKRSKTMDMYTDL